MKKIKFLGVLALSIIGIQVPVAVVSANTSVSSPNNISNLKSYTYDDIYINLSDEGKLIYLQDKNSSNGSGYHLRGIKKSVVTAALRYGGPAMGKIAGLLNKDAEHYLIEHSKLIANTLDGVSSGFRGAVVQALIKVGVPHSTASTIGWAVEKVLL